MDYQNNQTFKSQQSTHCNCNVYNTEFSAPFDVKDIDIIQDQLHREALAYKKCSVYSSQLTDQQLKSIVEKAAQHHKQHFNELQGLLDSHS